MCIATLSVPPNFNTIKASGSYKGELDYDWIYDVVVDNLSKIVHNNLTYNIPKGRYYGSNGSLYAAELIYRWMEENTKNLNVDIYNETVGDDNYVGDNQTWIRQANNKTDILSCGIKLRNSTSSATLPLTEFYPMPKLILDKEDAVNVTSCWGGSQWQKVNITSLESLLDDILQIPVLYAVMDDLNNAIEGTFGAEIVMIDDYHAATENQTAGKIHLLEFETNENDDCYQSKLDEVIESNGTGFIFITPNPSYIQNLSINILGVAVSPRDGARIKSYLNSHDIVIAAFQNESINGSGTLTMIPKSTCIGNRMIGLIQEHGTRYLGLTFIILLLRCFLPPLFCPYVGFFLYNKTYKTTHYMITPSPGISTKHSYKMYSKYVSKPFFIMNGTITKDDGENIDIWEWAKDDNLEAKYWIKEKRNESAKGYNVFCEVEGKNQTKSIMISGGHHDYLWGEGAADNAAGVAVMLGILKWLNESKITPEYNLTFVSWDGEETIVRGSKGHVFNQSNYEKDRNISYMINLDYIAWDNPDSILELPATNKSFALAIDNITKRTNYENITDYGLYIPPKDSKVPDDANPFWDAYVNNTPKKHHKAKLNDSGLEIVGIGKPFLHDITRHRTGIDNMEGDSREHIDRDDLNATADITLNITKYLILEPPENSFVNCSFKEIDQSGDGLNDSVNISYNVTTNLTSWATIKAGLYNVTTGQPVIDEIEKSFTIYKNRNISDFVILLLPYDKENDTYNASISIIDDRHNIDETRYQHVNLTRYSHPIADFTYVSYFNKNRIWFYDASTPSPGGTINSWNWSFGDGTYSEVKNPIHKYSDKGNYVVNLTVGDTNNLNDSVSKVIAVPNVKPYVSFSANNKVVVVGKSVSFTQTCNDIDGSIVNYTWNFGDGNYAYTANATHSYSKSGFYTVVLTVIDDDNAINSTAKTNYMVVADALVDDGFTDDPSNHKWDSIQEGINDVSNNDTIYVYNGIYQPYLVNKSLSIYGESKDGVILTPMPWDTSINIQCDDVYIDNFTIQGGMIGVNIVSTVNGTGNTTIENGTILGPVVFGVYIDNSTNNTIKDCSIDKADDGIKICNGAKYNVIDNCEIKGCINGVGIYSSSYNWVGNPSILEWYPNDCNFSLNTNAVYIDESDHNYVLGCTIDASGSPTGPIPQTKGIYLDESSNTTISTCKIFYGTQQGIYVKNSRDNKVEFSLIIDNTNGIECSGNNAKCNLIVQNNISDNSNYGVNIPAYPLSNKVYYNDFFDNGNEFTNQSRDDHTPDFGPPNMWCKIGGNLLTKKGLGEGNYWNDYTGGDLDIDGVGDSPYGIDGNAQEEDSYPLMEAYGWCTGTGWD